MTETYIHQVIPQRMRELAYTKYYERHRDFLLAGSSTMTIDAWNELYFIVDDPPGVVVESDYGMYDTTDNPLSENVHQHRGEIIIRNPGGQSRRVKFIQVIIVH